MPLCNQKGQHINAQTENSAQRMAKFAPISLLTIILSQLCLIMVSTLRR
jgi:hypothetical protein